MMIRNLTGSLLLASSLLVMGCGDDVERTDDANENIGSRSSTSFSEVRKEAGEALRVTGDYLAENTEDARRELSMRLRDIDDELADARMRLSRATADARVEIQEEIDELEVESRDLRARLSQWGTEAKEDIREAGRELEADTRETREDIREGTRSAGEDIKAEIHERTAPDDPAEAAEQRMEGDVPHRDVDVQD